MQLEWEDQVSKDKINPPHYKNNPIQTFDAITSQFSDAEKIGAIKFNICKYIMRMGKKVETLKELEMMLVKPLVLRDYLKNLQ